MYLTSTARDNVQLLVNQIFSLPIEKDMLIGPVAILPAGNNIYAD